MARANAVAVIALSLGALLVLPAALEAQDPRRRAHQARCQANLRTLALGAIQYADDKRFFPHLSRIADPDGGYTTSASPRITRSLVWFGYHDDPAGFVCPASPDEALEVLDPARANLRAWFWGQRYELADLDRPPITAGDHDPTLQATTELSYGWSRRGNNACVRSTTPLVADRTRDHHDGWLVAQVDGTVVRVERDEPAGKLTSLDADGGALGIQAPGDPPPASAATGPAPPWAGTWSDGEVTLRLERRGPRFRGALVVRGEERAVHGQVQPDGLLAGELDAEGRSSPFTARLDGATLELTSGSRTYRLTKREER